MLEVADWLVVADTVSIADSSLGKHYRVLKVISHPRFNRFNNDYDVGLLHTIMDIDLEGQRSWFHFRAGLNENILVYLMCSWCILRRKRVEII